MKYIFTATLFLLLTSLSCTKNKVSEAQLPPITQTGANTFGCLVNGKVWLPEGYISPTPNYRLTVDPNFSQGDFLLRVYRVYSTSPLKGENIYFGCDSIKNTGTYILTSTSRFKVGWAQSEYGIEAIDTSVYKKGYLKITRYDLAAGIFSGEFEFIMKKQGYDTLRITQGRFDKKL
ncbi:MAG: hypothetical protein JWP69_525 [Flaviaesturariibacter sp.]|nr:hypothetical protein [Flaviaesturariibacter sp.]